MPAVLLVSTAALEVTVHGWDVGQSLDDPARIPAELARHLRSVALGVVTPADRGPRFAPPVVTTPDAPPDQALLAHLGRAGGPPGQTWRIPPRERKPPPNVLLMQALGQGPVVEREAELTTFTRITRRAAAGRGSVLAVTGSAGIGKTRLLEQVASDATAAGWSVLMARAPRIRARRSTLGVLLEGLDPRAHPLDGPARALGSLLVTDPTTRAQAPDGGAAAARQEAIAAALRAIDRYETIPRRFPASGYSDNALFQAADLAGTLYAAYGRVAHRELVTKYVTWLVREYPSSSLRTEARAKLRSVEATRLAHLAGAASPPAPPRSQSPAAAPARPGGAAVVETPRPETPAPPTPAAGLPVLQTIERTVLPDVVRLTLPLNREVTFTHETLGNPPRAFIDLRGVTALPALLDTTLDGDDTVRQVRVGRRPDATRVVLDLETSAKVSVFALYNPFRW